MGNEQPKKREVAGDPNAVPGWLADRLSKCWPVEKADEALGYWRRIAEALETMNESAARRSREWLDPDDVATELKVSHDTARRLIANGDIRSKRIQTRQGTGRRSLIRITREWLDDYMNDADAKSTGHHPESKPRRRRRRGADADGETDYFA